MNRETAKRRRSRKTKLAPRSAKPYRYLDHPADVGFMARGRTLEELFANAARAMCDYGWGSARVLARKKVEIRARAATLEDLMFSWLSELLFLTDAEKWVFKAFDISSIEQPFGYAQGKLTSEKATLWEIRAVARGERFTKSRHRVRTYIKAVTYHQLAVRRTALGWQATVFLDV